MKKITNIFLVALLIVGYFFFGDITISNSLELIKQPYSEDYKTDDGYILFHRKANSNDYEISVLDTAGSLDTYLATYLSNPGRIGGTTPGAGYFTTLSATGEIVGANYKTIFIPASACTATATNGADLATNEYATNDINMDFYAFDGATEQFIEIQFPMPEDWNRGTIKAKFFWSSASGSTATTDNCEWEIQAGALSNDDAIDAALGTAQVISDVLLANNGTDLQVSNATPAITVGGTPALGDLVHFKVSRNVGGTDNMTEDAWLFGIWIQYLANTAVVTW